MTDIQRNALRQLLKSAVMMHYGILSQKMAMGETIPANDFGQANAQLMLMARDAGLNDEEVLRCMREVDDKIMMSSSDVSSREQ